MTRSARVAGVAVLFTLTGCAALEGLLRQGVVRPEVTVLSAVPTSADFEGLTVAVELRVQNPNAMGLRVAGLSWQVDVEGGRVASGEAPGGLSIPANGAATSRVTARVRFADLSNLMKLAEAREKVAFRVAGKVTVETPIGPIDVPWSYAGEAPVPQLPSVELAGVRLGRQTLSETEVLVTLRLRNPNAFPLPAAVAAGESATLELPARISLLGAGRAILGARRGPVRIAARGTAGFGWMQLPFSVSGDLPLP
jgi:LEA14-like dessication related protein